jgi:hypothetical protein
MKTFLLSSTYFQSQFTNRMAPIPYPAIRVVALYRYTGSGSFFCRCGHGALVLYLGPLRMLLVPVVVMYDIVDLLSRRCSSPA